MAKIFKASHAVAVREIQQPTQHIGQRTGLVKKSQTIIEEECDIPTRQKATQR